MSSVVLPWETQAITNPNPVEVRQDSLLAHAGRDLKQASTKDLATSFVERAGKPVFS